MNEYFVLIGKCYMLQAAGYILQGNTAVLIPVTPQSGAGSETCNL
jgi:hypothetical protein